MRIQSFGFWWIQGPGWLLLIYLIVAQGIPAIDYQIGVDMGTQEPASRISEVGVAFWKGFALGDLLIYIPLLAAGLVGHWRNTRWGVGVLTAAAGITVYWPAVCLAAVAAAKGAEGWRLESTRDYWVVLPLIALWGAVAFMLLLNRRD